MNGEKKSVKLYEYADDGTFLYMHSHFMEDTLVSYKFTGDLLTGYVHYLASQQIPLQTMELRYVNNRLDYVKSENEAGIVEMKVTTDDVGNITVFDILSVNGNPPDQQVRYLMEYDDQHNPYYKMPGFMDLTLYFSPNNMTRLNVEVDGKPRLTDLFYTYTPEGFIASMQYENDYATYYSYACP